MIITDLKLLRQKSDACINELEANEVTHKLLKEIEKHPNAVGLSAPQIGIFKRVFLIKTETGIIRFWNPELVVPSIRTENCTKDIPKIYSEEGCLSIPGKTFFLYRYPIIEVVQPDSNEGLISGRFSGLNAIVIQHENDHLDGKTLWDTGVEIK